VVSSKLDFILVGNVHAYSCANNLDSKDPRKLWDNVFKVGNNKATKYASTV